MPGLYLQGGFLREQEEFCTLQKEPRENTGVCTQIHRQYMHKQHTIQSGRTIHSVGQ